MSKSKISENITLAKIMLESNPKSSEAQYILAKEYFLLKKYKQAVIHINNIISDTNSAEIVRLAANIYAAQKDYQRVINLLTNIQKSSEATEQDLINLAQCYMTCKKYQEAKGVYNQILEKNPKSYVAIHNRAFADEKLGNKKEALGGYAFASTLDPKATDAYLNKGNVLFELKNYEGAIKEYDNVLKIDGENAAAKNNKANSLISLKKLTEAEELIKSVISKNPSYAAALNNLGFCFQKQNRHLEAIEPLERAVGIEPTYFEAINNLAHSYHKTRQFQTALDNFEKAIEINPNYYEGIWNRSLINLLLGNYEVGWKDMLSRYNRPSYQNNRTPRDRREWNGEPLKGESITVWVEQGFGDMILFSRYLKVMLDMGAKNVSFIAPPVIHRLMQSISPSLNILSKHEKDDPKTYHTSIFSLPHHFKTKLHNIPYPNKYLYAEPDKVKKWKKIIGHHGFKIGISWQGNPAGDVDLGRSIPLKFFYPLTKIPGVRVISLQFQHGLEQLSDLPDDIKIETLGKEFNGGPDGFIDTAAVMECLDLVITSDSAPANLAGALGVPCWTLLMYVADFRWLIDRSDSPWFESIRLFRQSEIGNWKYLMNEVELALREKLSFGVGSK